MLLQVTDYFFFFRKLVRSLLVVELHFIYQFVLVAFSSACMGQRRQTQEKVTTSHAAKLHMSLTT